MRGKRCSTRATDFTAPPTTFVELAHRLRTAERRKRGGLSAVAAFALEKPLEIALGTVGRIAEQCNTYPPTVVHLAQAVGFTGFVEMRAFVQRRCRS